MSSVAALVKSVFGKAVSCWGPQDFPSWKDRHDLNQVQRFEAILNRSGLSFQRFHSILDFGCGSGRLIRHVAEIARSARLFGCDVVPQNIEDCRRVLPLGTFIVNDWKPPLPYEDGVFDCIFSYSVFTHLSEQDHADWLGELARLLGPNGVMLHTTHSAESVRRMQVFSPWALEKYQLPEEPLRFLESHSYHHAPYSVETPEYRLAIISRQYVLTQWPRITGTRVLDYVDSAIEAFPEGCQDAVLLAKP